MKEEKKKKERNEGKKNQTPSRSFSLRS